MYIYKNLVYITFFPSIQTKKVTNIKILINLFLIISITLLSLLLPSLFFSSCKNCLCSFLLSQLTLSSPNSSIFLYTNPSIVYILVSTISIATLGHTLPDILTSTLQSQSHYIWSPLTLGYSHPYAASIFLLTLQVSIGLGIKVTEVLGY